MGLTIAELASNFIPFNRKIGKKYSPSLPGKHRIIKKNLPEEILEWQMQTVASVQKSLAPSR